MNDIAMTQIKANLLFMYVGEVGVAHLWMLESFSGWTLCTVLFYFGAIIIQKIIKLLSSKKTNLT